MLMVHMRRAPRTDAPGGNKQQASQKGPLPAKHQL
jgi:hypothetical protein